MLRYVVLTSALLACVLNSSATAADLSSVLGAAAQREDVTRIRELIAEGVDPNDAAFFGMTPLCLTVGDDEAEHVDSVAALLAGGADPNQKCGPAERAPLHDAALDGDLTTLRLLFAAGADVNIRNRFGRTALFYALHPAPPLRPPKNASEVARLLRAFGAVE